MNTHAAMDDLRLPEALRPDLILLDRGGVLNRNLDQGVRQPDDWTWLPGSVAAVRHLASEGRRLMVITNQANIGRGLLSTAVLDSIHRRMVGDLQPAGLTLSDVLYCPHRREDGCGCRKPEPGLVTGALKLANTSAAHTILIGDHETDIAAAADAGCWSLHVRSGRGAPPTGRWNNYLGSVADLRTAARVLTLVGR
jgi:D-glycero-D-manno-heptose 1,7-bisphosphate phosphatase